MTHAGTRSHAVAAPDIARADAGVSILRTFTVGSPERQAAVIDAASTAILAHAVPPSLRAMTWLASTDGEHLASFAQWTTEDEAAAFGRRLGPAVQQAVAARVPGIAPSPAVPYRLYRSVTGAVAPPPGCIVLVSVEFDGPDASRQRAWIDLVLEALAAEPSPPRGGLSGHFHVSLDGTRVLNYAEWIDEASHVEATERAGSIGRGAAWQRVHAFPGIVGSRVMRYRIASHVEQDFSPASSVERNFSPSSSVEQDFSPASGHHAPEGGVA